MRAGDFMRYAGWIALALRVALGAVLGYAAYHKLGETATFALQIANYRVLPPQANQFLAVTLPWVELTAGSMLILGIWVRPAALVSAGLMAAFAVGVIQALARDLHIACGCFELGESSEMGVTTVLIQAACLGAAIAIVVLSRKIEAAGRDNGA